MYVCVRVSVSVGGYVGACSAAEGEGGGSVGPGRAGFLKISQVLFQFLFPDPKPGPIPGPGQRPFTL